MHNVYSRVGPSKWVLHGCAPALESAEAMRERVAEQHPTRPTAVIEDRKNVLPTELHGALIGAIEGGGSHCAPPLRHSAGWTWIGGRP